MLIKTIVVGNLDTNCYIVTDEQTLKSAVIDPGGDSNAILDYIEDNSSPWRPFCSPTAT
jgi:glyoxylase-like metal-dependent hydrolase (beta-lactamase superfamily II)